MELKLIRLKKTIATKTAAKDAIKRYNNKRLHLSLEYKNTQNDIWRCSLILEVISNCILEQDLKNKVYRAASESRKDGQAAGY